MYAIQNTKTGEFVYGTDYRYHPWHQRCSKNRAMLFETLTDAVNGFKERRCGKDYVISCVRLDVITSYDITDVE